MNVHEVNLQKSKLGSVNCQLVLKIYWQRLYYMLASNPNYAAKFR